MKRGKVKIDGEFQDICPPGGGGGLPVTGQTISYWAGKVHGNEI